MRVRNHFFLAVYKSGTGTSGRVCGDLGLKAVRRGTLGHQVWDTGTGEMGTRGRQVQGRRRKPSPARQDFPG